MAIERHFIGWEQPALPLVAEYLIRHYATKDDLDLSNVILVFPARRAARRMLELLVECAAARFPALIPPRMVTFLHFPELLYPQQKKLADELTQLLVWMAAISAVPKQQIQPAIAALPPETSLPSWMNLCDSLRRQHDELAAEGLDFDDVFRILSRTELTEETQRWKALRRIQSEYLMQMDALELWDRQTARLIAVDQQECTTKHDIILVGTVDMNGIVKKMLDQVANRVTALICAPKSIADHFDQWGCLIADKWRDRTVHIPEETTLVKDDPQDQAGAVVDHIASLNGTTRADEIAVGVTDDSLVPVILQSLALAGVTGRWPIGARVRASRPWRLLEAVASHLATADDSQNSDFPSLANLVRHPDVTAYIEQQLQKRGLPAATNWLAELDGYRADHLQPIPGRILGYRRRAEIVECLCTAVTQLLSQLCPDSTSAGTRVNISEQHRTGRSVRQSHFDDSGIMDGDTVHRGLRRRRPLNAWATGTLRLLNLVYADYSIGEIPQRDKSMIACLNALSELNASLQQIPDEVMPMCTAAQAIPVLLMQIGDRNIAAAPDDSAIDLMGWLELPLDDCPVVTVAGFNEGWVPQSTNSDVFLPNTIRTQLGLTDNKRRYARDTWALETLLNSRQQVRLIAGRRDVRGDPLAPSRLWFAGKASDIPDRVLQFYEERQTDSSPTEDQPKDLPDGLSITRKTAFVVPAPPRLAVRPNQIPVTHFRDYISCPYRYLLRREIGLVSIEDQPREMDGRLFGNLLHAVLSRFGMDAARHAGAVDSIERALLNNLHIEASERFGNQLSATVAVQLQMAEERLRAFAQWQAQQVSDGWSIEFCERSLEYNLHDTLGRPLTIVGRIDRIDRHNQSGEWRVLDYKTSEKAQNPKATHRKKGDWIDLQLPLYRLLVREMGIDSNMQLGYVNLPGDLKYIGTSIADWTPEELNCAEEKAKQVAAQILDLKIDGVQPAGGMFEDELTGICQDSVVDRRIPWLTDWPGRSNVQTKTTFNR
ncbi:MAG: PD-(D/E)XK nuclease family protein [Fuerstiella sp.]|nr:PD-(D/E)XK nuclease family protein [Fuerstiella sp.]